MTSRDAILHRVRSELSKLPGEPAPEPVEVWPRRNPSLDELVDRFAKELQEVSGEVEFFGTMRDAALRLAELARQEQWTAVGAMDRALIREAAGELPSGLVRWAAPDWTPREMAEFSAGLIEAETLPADTGSCLIVCPTAADRLLCYLPPTCVVIARRDRLVEHLQAAWPAVVARSADPAARGECVLVTGPSRTADIEKILILGVHGPKRLIAMLVAS